MDTDRLRGGMSAKIHLIEQPTHNSCTSACLAMMTGKPIEELMQDFHGKWLDESVQNSQYNPFTYLFGNGFSPVLNCNPYKNQMEFGACYLVTVPSLNIEGGLHSIVVDCRCDDVAGVRLYDPARVSAGSRVYVMFDSEIEEGKRVLLNSFQVDLSIS